MTLREFLQRWEARRAAVSPSWTAPVQELLDEVLNDVRQIAADDHREPLRLATGDELLDAPAAARRLGMSVSWVYKMAHTLPFTVQVGSRAVRFSAAGIERWLRQRRAA